MSPVPRILCRSALQSRSPFLARQSQNALSRSSARAARRFQSTDAPVAEAAAKSLLARVWSSPVGPKTVHFWAPIMKWAVVIAGVSDFYRPPEKLSLTQNLALTATGIIWTRWCLIIKPKNYFLASVNFCLGCVGVVQVGRIIAYERSKDKAPTDELNQAKDNAAAIAEGVKNEAKAVVSS